jgi:hypothetical protein
MAPRSAPIARKFRSVPGFENTLSQIIYWHFIEPFDFPEISLDAARELADLCAVDDAMIESTG